MPEIRLQKYIAGSGLCSRRKAEELIVDGRVKVNGNIVTELGNKINTDSDEVLVDDRKITMTEDFKYIILNKPVRICYDSKRSI